MVTEPWQGAPAPPAEAEARRIQRLGHFPGFYEAKRLANEARAKKRLDRRQTSIAPLAGLMAPSSGIVFDGPSEFSTDFIPPDPIIAAGPNHLVVCINSLIAIYSKAGIAHGTFQQFSTFFSNLGIAGEIFDPRVIYDQANNRFIPSAAEVDMSSFTNGHVLLAVSQTSDPTGVWNKFALDFRGRNLSNTADTFPDFPTLGLSSSDVYISTSQFVLDPSCMQNDTCSFSDTWVRVIDLQGLLTGSATLNIMTFEDVRSALGFQAFAIEPAVTYGPAPAEFLAAASYESNPGSVLNVFAINLSGTPTLSAADLDVPQFSFPPDAVQPGGTFPIATNDIRLLNAVWANGSLRCGHNVLQSSNLGVVARWYEINAPSLSGLALAQTGDVTGSGDAYFPALGIKQNGDVGMVFTTSSFFQFASAAFTGRATTDAPNTMRQSAILRAGTSVYQDRAIRWGDYSGLLPDPDGASFWMIAEYAGSPNPHFATAIAQVFDVPDINLSTSVINFGSETLNVPSAPQTVTITNSSSSTITLGNASIAGFNAADFAISADGCSGNALNPASSCDLSVTFTPSSLGNRNAVLVINTNPSALVQQILLIGTGATATANISVSPTVLNFPDTPLRTASSPRSIQVTNIGGDAIKVVSNLGVSAFSVSNKCGGSLAGGKSCNIDVTFRPYFQGTNFDALAISYVGFPLGTAPPSVNLTGKGVTDPGLSLCPTTVAFGNQTVGTSTSPTVVALNNSGSDDLTVTGLAVSSEFTAVSNCGSLPATIPPRTACNINVTFTPAATGIRTGTLTRHR
jgi:hypothetical protein